MSNSMRLLDEAAADFFRLYALLEFAIKSDHRFVKPAGRGDPPPAGPDWEVFLRHCGELPPLPDVLTFMQTEPPNRQVIIMDGGRVSGLRWVPVEHRGKDGDFLIACMRAVRNNIVHGGKSKAWFVAGEGERRDRTRSLLERSVIILGAIVDVAPPTVRSAFYDPSALL